MPDVALLIDWENVYYTMRQHTEGPLPSTLSILQAILTTRAMKLLYKDRPDLDTWFIVSGDRDLNALCKALKDEDKHVYLVAGDKSLANELRDSPYLRDDVFLLEDLIPQARWTRTALRADDTQVDKPQPQL